MLRPHHATPTAHYGVRYSWQRGAPAFRSGGDDLLRAAVEKVAERATADSAAVEAAAVAVAEAAAAAEGAVVAAEAVAAAIAKRAVAARAVVAEARTAAMGKLALVAGPVPLPTVSAAAIEVAAAAAAWVRASTPAVAPVRSWASGMSPWTTVWKRANCWANRRRLLPCRPLSPTSLLTHARRRPQPSQTHRLAGYS